MPYRDKYCSGRTRQPHPQRKMLEGNTQVKNYKMNSFGSYLMGTLTG